MESIYTDPASSGSFGGVQRLYRAARSSGLTVSKKQTKAFLYSQSSYGQNRYQRINFKRRKFKTRHLNEIWQLDLAFLEKLWHQNGGVRYLLFCLDTYSRFLRIFPLRNKKASSVAAAMQSLFKEIDVRPNFVVSDDGTEFLGETKQLFERLGIKYYTLSGSPSGCPHVERSIRTIKKRIMTYLTANKTKRYIDVLQNIVTSYNNSPHQGIKNMKPADITTANEHLLQDVNNPALRVGKTKFQLGDNVRVQLDRKTFHRGFQPQFSKEVYTVSGYVYDDPVTYKLKTLDGEDVAGAYYFEQLVKSL